MRRLALTAAAIFAAALSVIWLGEVFALHHAVALGLVLGGFALVGAIAFGISDGAMFWGVVAGYVVVGYVLGNMAKRRKCSNCDEPLLVEDEICEGCGGVIKGKVSNTRELRAAEAALKKK